MLVSNDLTTYTNLFKDALALCYKTPRTSRYNDRTYKVEDIDFDKNPHFTFTFRNKEISVAEYYKMKYNIEIRNFDQPLLSVRPKKRELRAGSPEIIYLVPELCHITGINCYVLIN